MLQRETSDLTLLPLLQYFVFSFISFLFVSVISILSLCQILLRLQKLFAWVADWKWLRPSSTKHTFRCWNLVNIMLVRFACQISSSPNICSLTALILCNSLKSLVHTFWTDFSLILRKRENKRFPTAHLFPTIFLFYSISFRRKGFLGCWFNLFYRNTCIVSTYQV